MSPLFGPRRRQGKIRGPQGTPGARSRNPLGRPRTGQRLGHGGQSGKTDLLGAERKDSVLIRTGWKTDAETGVRVASEADPVRQTRTHLPAIRHRRGSDGQVGARGRHRPSGAASRLRAVAAPVRSKPQPHRDSPAPLPARMAARPDRNRAIRHFRPGSGGIHAGIRISAQPARPGASRAGNLLDVLHGGPYVTLHAREAIRGRRLRGCSSVG